MLVQRIHDGLEVRSEHEILRIEPWGTDSIRVRAGWDHIVGGLPGALDERPAGSASEPRFELGETSARLTNGAIVAVVANDVGDGGDAILVRFENAATGAELLAEQRGHFWWPGARAVYPLGGGRARIEQHFRAYQDERIYGLGQRTHGRLNQKGMSLDLLQRNSEVCIPFLVSSRGYGFLWNNPAVGHVELAENRTRWVADASRQIDYWITAGNPAQIMSHYADATGHAPVLPEWASGFWQSKLRYRTQDELLAVAREYKRRGLPLSVIVIDFFHWIQVGNWKFDPADWPDPKAMVDELRELGVRVMVSVWPLVSPFSENWDEMAERGLLVGVQQGLPYTSTFPDRGMPKPFGVAHYDATNPEARAFLWSKIKQNYFDLGIKVWWLDACEPELRPVHPSALRFHAGEGDEILNIYPQMHARTFFEGMHAAGEEDVISLARSAWAGSQKYGAAVWSGDIPTTFDSLRRQIRAGLNIALSGIPWWTTDIGGFHGGDPTSPEYRELVVRWFEYGVFCPLFRIHGDRVPRLPFGPNMTGSANEVWAFGDEAYEIIRSVLLLRERIRPYLMRQMQKAHEDGLPPMRPLFVDFPTDEKSWLIDDEFLLGPDVLVAPIVEAGARARDVYLPPGLWIDAWTGTRHSGGTTLHADAPLERIPVFVREGSDVPIAV
ncbi:MAG: glycoside hydrolase family 31 protein [Candidatus Limnocylindrales bacterium]|jgi:alpha-D-xyloside xylohydrolase